MTEYKGPGRDKKKKKRRRMNKLRITELSSVTKPAQEGARQVLMKHADSEQLEKGPGMNMGRPMLLSVVGGHQHLIDAADGTSGMTTHEVSEGEEFGHSHPWIKNMDGSITIGMAEGHTHQVLEMKADTGESSNGEGSGDAATAADNDKETEMSKDIDKSAEELEAAKEQLQKQTAEIERLTALTGLSPEHRSFFDGLEKSAQEEFLKLDSDAREAQISKTQGEDPVVYTTMDGDEIHKSAGAMVEKMARQLDDQKREMAVMKKQREDNELQKTADSLNFPAPSNEEKLEVVSALAKTKAGLSILKSYAELTQRINSSMGSTLAPETTENVSKADAEEQLERLAKSRAEEKGTDFYEAYNEVLKTQEGQELYRATVRQGA